jgi:Bifunctional DNA primase/polymerase, N-terminal
MTRLEYALGMLAAGVSLVPIGTNGDKRPAMRWKCYQERLPKPWEVRSWIRHHGWGIAAVGGKVSANLEILDFDEAEYFEHWGTLIESYHPRIIEWLPLVCTPSGGYHLYYRCDVIEGNQKLAQSAVQSESERRWLPGKTRIETRGEGGYVVTPASPRTCHPAGERYRLLHGHLWQIPKISIEQRTCFLRCARAFNEYVEPPKRVFEPRATHETDRPGDVFAATHSWEDILMPHGWQVVRRHGDLIEWKRPGKRDRGQSATTGYQGHDVFYVFSTNAYPFESRRGYDKFHVHVILNYGGDYHTAAKALVRR